jgi:hypothetical protein
MSVASDSSGVKLAAVQYSVYNQAAATYSPGLIYTSTSGHHYYYLLIYFI